MEWLEKKWPSIFCGRFNGGCSFSGASISKFEEAGARFDELIQKFFFKWGLFCAKHTVIVLLGSAILLVACCCGWVFFTVTTDPVELWSSPLSRARTEKNYFDQHFGRFYRTEQIIIRPKNTERVYNALQNSNQSYSSVFDKEFLREVISFHHIFQSRNVIHSVWFLRFPKTFQRQLFSILILLHSSSFFLVFLHFSSFFFILPLCSLFFLVLLHSSSFCFIFPHFSSFFLIFHDLNFGNFFVRFDLKGNVWSLCRFSPWRSTFLTLSCPCRIRAGNRAHGMWHSKTSASSPSPRKTPTALSWVSRSISSPTWATWTLFSWTNTASSPWPRTLTTPCTAPTIRPLPRICKFRCRVWAWPERRPFPGWRSGDSMERHMGMRPRWLSLFPWIIRWTLPRPRKRWRGKRPPFPTSRPIRRPIWPFPSWWRYVKWEFLECFEKTSDWLVHWTFDSLIDGLIGHLCHFELFFLRSIHQIFVFDWIIDWLIDWLKEWKSDWKIDWLNDWMVDWLIVRFIDWMNEWLIDWLIDYCAPA